MMTGGDIVCKRQGAPREFTHIAHVLFVLGYTTRCSNAAPYLHMKGPYAAAGTFILVASSTPSGKRAAGGGLGGGVAARCTTPGRACNKLISWCETSAGGAGGYCTACCCGTGMAWG